MFEIVLDTETTGLDPDQNHRIIEIGCVELQNRLPTGRTYQQYVNPERDVPDEAYAISKISTDSLHGKPLFAEIADAFLDFIGDKPLVIHNAAFDLRFLNSELKRLKKPLIPFERAIDTLQIARKRFPGGQTSLDALCKRFAISLAERETKGHGALLDCHLLAKVYVELTGGRQASLGLAGEETAQGPVQHKPAKRRPAPLPSLLTEEEREAHAKLVAKLKGEPLWPLAQERGE